VRADLASAEVAGPAIDPLLGRADAQAGPAATAGLAGANARAVAVIDTNAWLDLYVFGDPQARELAQALQARSILAVRSHRTDAELQAVLQRPALAARCAAPRRAALVDQWLADAQPMSDEAILPAPWTCRDADDQKFLDLANSSGAAWLITKDRALLELARKTRRNGLQIVTPAVFAATFAQAAAAHRGVD
jgi:putative PIN family toxin of toxin-antitoxin system